MHARTAVNPGRGFTLIELAIGLVVVAMLATAVLVPLVTQVTQRKISTTESILEQAAEALMGYAAATGRLPCPATAANAGRETFAAGGTPANGQCATYSGFLPAVTLGFTPIDAGGFAIDGWGTQQNRIRYAVPNSIVWPPPADPNPNNYVFTRTGGVREVRADVVAAAQLLIVCSSGAKPTGAEPNPTCGPGAVTLTTNAPAVIWSNGANAAIGGRSDDEEQNPHPNNTPGGGWIPNGSADRIFVSRTRNENFDDIVTWLSVPNLVSRMILAGQLP